MVIIGPIAAETISPIAGRIPVIAEIDSVIAVVFIAADALAVSTATPPDTAVADFRATDLMFFLENFSLNLEIIKGN
ncbi:hypothetical protein MSWHS_3120 [Methanosarcina sp. WWM596]|nr:hypothetical protein MSWHS_3120 [Methanosarcina sp. WWM596]